VMSTHKPTRPHRIQPAENAQYWTGLDMRDHNVGDPPDGSNWRSPPPITQARPTSQPVPPVIGVSRCLTATVRDFLVSRQGVRQAPRNAKVTTRSGSGSGSSAQGMPWVDPPTDFSRESDREPRRSLAL
jgi:hypothetical protein